MILKGIEIEQLELYERYHVEKSMQAEDYQKGLKEHSINNKEYETDIVDSRNRHEENKEARI